MRLFATEKALKISEIQYLQGYAIIRESESFINFMFLHVHLQNEKQKPVFKKISRLT